MNHKILIVEDEAKLREVLCDYFASRGERPIQACDGFEALARMEECEFDAVLLDIMMPGLDGLSVCRAVRKTNDVPILFLTALSDEEDKLLGYELGADDYITKPFSLSVRPCRRPHRSGRHHPCALHQEGFCRQAGYCLDAERIRAFALPHAKQKQGAEPGAAFGQMLGL